MSPLSALQDSLFYSSPSSPPTTTARRASAAARTPEMTANFTTMSANASPSPSSSRVRTGRGSGSSTGNSQRKRVAKGTPGVTADKFKLHFAGRVYRPLVYASPKAARKMYTTTGDWLGQPDEVVDPSHNNEEEEGSETRCVCGVGPNSSLMIQCEDCETWQHAQCMGFTTEENCPEVYFCKECAPTNTSRGRTNASASMLEGPWTSDTASTSSATHRDRARTPPPQPDLLRQSQVELQRTPESHRSTAKSSVMLGSSDIESDDDGLEVTPSSPSLRELAGSGSRSGSGSGSRSALPRPPYWSPTASPSARKVPAAAALLATAGTPSKSAYAASRQLLAQAAFASPLVRAGPSHPLLTPSKTTRVASPATSDLQQITPTKSGNTRSIGADQEEDEVDLSSLPLPEHYTALLALHSAVERALLLHLATEGSRAGALVASAGNSEALGNDELQVDLPNLVTYNQIRAVVERGAGKRFGPLELGQLVWLWEGGLDGARASEDDTTFADSDVERRAEHPGRRGGLSLSVQATRQLDKMTGKKVYTWGIGLDLRLKQNVQLPTFEVLNSGSSAPGTPARSGTSNAGESPNSAGRMLKRQGMSVLPLWSNKAESRKLEMRRRLGQCVAKAHDNFLASSSSSSLVGDSPSKKRKVVHFDEQYALPSPPQSAGKAQRKWPFKPGFILDALPPIPSATLPHLGPARSSPLKKSAHASSASLPATAAAAAASIASVDAATARADIEKQITTSASAAEKRKQLEAGTKVAETAGGPKVTPEKRQSSLMERIKAKEAERLAALAAGDGTEKTSSLNGRSGAPQSVARSSLEMASMRAEKRQAVARAL